MSGRYRPIASVTLENQRLSSFDLLQMEVLTSLAKLEIETDDRILNLEPLLHQFHSSHLQRLSSLRLFRLDYNSRYEVDIHTILGIIYDWVNSVKSDTSMTDVIISFMIEAVKVSLGFDLKREVWRVERRCNRDISQAQGSLKKNKDEVLRSLREQILTE